MSTSPAPFARELALALEAAAEGAALIAARDGAAEVREKGRADLVTAVDEAVERRVCARLLAALPGVPVVGEEFTADAAPAGRHWILDPVDGTANFVHGHPFVCLSLALVDERGPAVAVVNAPCLGEVYHATRGGGAFRNGAPIRVSAAARLADSLLATGFPFKAGKGDLEQYMAMGAAVIRASRDLRRAGSAALDCAFTAAGRLDGYFEVGVNAWDIAAGVLLVTEAGGRVTGWPGDRADPLRTGRVIATNGGIHEELAALLEPWVGRIAGK